MVKDKSIKIWEFEDAPEEFKALSEHGGDEDGIIFIPAGVKEPWWLESLWRSYGGEQRIENPEGTYIIWAHA